MSLYGNIEIVGRPSLENVRKLDLLPMPAINEMMRVGFAIDIPYLNELTKELESEIEELRIQICSHIPEEKLDEFIARSGMDSEDDYLPMNVGSPVQLADLLFDVLGIGFGRQLKLTKGGDRISTGKKQLEQLKRLHPIVQIVLDYRERAKLVSTYTKPLPKKAVLHRKAKVCWCGFEHEDDSWRVHTKILTTRTATGRLASKDPNLQNISTRTALGRRVRAGFVASPGMEIAQADFSQVEMRIGGRYSKDENLLRIFRERLDPHTDTARRAFKTETPDKLTQRDPCKNVNFGVFYGLGGPGLYDLMAVTYATAKLDLPDWLTVEWCEEFIKQWFELYPGVKGYLEQQTYRARRYGMVWDLFGRIRRVPECCSVHHRIVAAGLRQAGNMPIQTTSAGMTKLAMAMVQDRVIEEFRADGIVCWPLMSVHDELLNEVQVGYGDLMKTQMEVEMEHVLTDIQTGESLSIVPIQAEGKVMERWIK